MRLFQFIFIICGLFMFVSNNTAQATKAKAKAKPAKMVNVDKQIAAEKKPGVHMTFETEHIDIGKVKKGEIKKFVCRSTHPLLRLIQVRQFRILKSYNCFVI